LHKVGKPNGHRIDPTLLWVEKTTVLVDVGAYKYVRHPLYCSFFFLTWSVFLIAPSSVGWALALFATLSLIVAARVEERENEIFFGAAYCDYVKRTKMFIPFVV
jgi:protein-S-isoprenylcysteine O-methyltransferase Ste14